MKCLLCGARLTRDAKICPGCGADVHIEIRRGQTFARVQKDGGALPDITGAQFSERLLNNQCPFCGTPLSSSSGACPGCNAKITHNAGLSTRTSGLGSKLGINLQFTRGDSTGFCMSDAPELINKMMRQAQAHEPGKPTQSTVPRAGHGGDSSRLEQSYSLSHQPGTIKESRPVSFVIILLILGVAGLAAFILFYLSRH